MFQKFLQHITDKFPYIKDKKLLIAVSGGIDSIVLTHLLYNAGIDVSLAHCNFKLRGNDSDLDEAFVKALGAKLNIDVYTTCFNTKEYAKDNKVSIQLAARELRYNWFNTLIEESSLAFLITAHHADDNLETFLINLTRGTGLDGLTGIPEKNRHILRPLLPFSRQDILNYARQNTISWREDKSNLEEKYLRNKIRHGVIPILKEVNPNLLQSAVSTINHLQETKQIVDDRVAEVSEKIIVKDIDSQSINIEEVLKLSNPKAYLYQLLKPYGFTEWDKVYNLLFAQTGKFLETKSYILLKNREFLLFSLKDFLKEDHKKYIIHKDTEKIQKPIVLKFTKTVQKKIVSKKVILVDKNLLIYPLIIRKIKHGDIFYPTGMLGKKKVSKYFKDEKLSKIDKINTWLLCDNSDQIIWIVGMRQDRRYTISSSTENILKISL